MRIKVTHLRNAFDYLEREYQLHRTPGSIDFGRVRTIENFRDDFKPIVAYDEDSPTKPLMVAVYNGVQFKGVTLLRELMENVKRQVEHAKASQSASLDTSS